MEVASRKFFEQSKEEKRTAGRDEVKPMGYYDTEHTKNVRDWKEVFDAAVENPTVISASDELDDNESPRALICRYADMTLSTWTN
ncbi:hypothetical protein RJ640_023814 [Escallonia rubra]|uniref:Non-haem dioxygenase N-terminal domain-containing protein n=1 Tax=Escallonia rubra TaxID=112253 RepID=A0AA88RJX3_9ASTE|nr:hypothetical protein RJ640_023814 [Escallonia rubra]